MKLFKKDYRAERQFMRESYIRWRGRPWFLWLYGIIATIGVIVVSMYITIIVDLIIRIVGPYAQAFKFYMQSGVAQWPEFNDVMNMTATVLNPLNIFTILSRLTLVTSIVLILCLLLLLKKYVFQRIYDWYQLFRDQTRNTNRFAEVREVDKVYKLIPDRNKNFKGRPGQPVLHTQGYTFEFFMIHPFLWAWQWFKRPLGMNSLEFSGVYKKIRPVLLEGLPKLFEKQLNVQGGFDGFYWVDTSNTHSKTTGMTRSSKDQMRGYTLIDIIRRAEIKWNIIDTDAKNEDAKMSYKSLRTAGYDVKLLNIMEPSESESWNPLEIAIDYAFDGDWDSANTELRKVVQVIGGSSGEESSHKDIWDSAAESTIQAVMLTVLDIAVRHQDKSMVTISNVLQFINDMNKFTDKEGDGLTKYITNIGKLPRTPARNMIILNAAEYLSATGDTKSSISFSVMNRLNLFASESITRLTTFNTINLTDLGFPRMLKIKFSDRYKGVHVSIHGYESGKKHAIEKDKLTVSQSGTLTYPIHNHLPVSWQIELSLDNDGNSIAMRKQSFTLTGKIVQRKLLNGKIKRDLFSKQPVIQCLVDQIKPQGTTETPGVTLRYSENPMAVFIITPQSNDDFSALASLFISQVFSVNTDIASTITRRKMDSWILYKLNEFSMFPRIPGFTNILTRGLTYGHLVDLYIQTLTQPRLHYSEMETNDINGNTGNWFHILTNDEQTNEALSKQLGEVEVQTESVNSQIGLDRQDRGNRHAQVSKVRLLDAKEISELSPREMITIRTIKRADKKGRSVRPLPIFSTGAYRMPFAYELLGKQYSLDYYTADLNIKAQHNDLKYDDLYHDFVPYFDELDQQVQLEIEEEGAGGNQIDNRQLNTLADDEINNILAKAHQGIETAPVQTQQELSDEERYLQWKHDFNPDEPFMNADKTKAFVKPVADVYVTANSDNSTIDNKFTEFVNNDSNTSEVVHNTTPTVTPVKKDLDDNGNDINGKDVKPNTVMNYDLTWDLSGLKDATIGDDTYAKELSFFDDYDETKLDITAKTKTDFTMTDETTKKSVASEVTLTWDEKKGSWTIVPNDKKAFIKNHGGNKIEIAFKPVVKSDATGKLTNTAVQNNFGETYKTQTVTNNITPNPKPKPDTPATPNTSYGEAPKGWLYGAIATIALAGAAFGFRKPIKKWFHK